MKRMNCSVFQTEEKYWDYFEVDSLADARPDGYRANLQLSVIANKSAAIILSSTNDKDTANYYDIRMIDFIEVTLTMR